MAGRITGKRECKNRLNSSAQTAESFKKWSRFCSIHWPYFDATWVLNHVHRPHHMALPSEIIDSPRVPRIGPYSQAVRVGDLVYTAGQPGIDPITGKVAGDSFEAQARQAFVNLRAVLEDAGTSLGRVIKVTCFVADPKGFAELNSLFTEFFPVAPPVRSTPLVQLPRGLLFSIDAIAVVDEAKP
jgi:2-iminobutanoate/2-iminopropanoate deaminase